MDLEKIWQDDLLSFVAFLVVILPVPFLYVFFDSTGELDAVMLSYYSFVGTAVLWMVLALVYVLWNSRSGSDSEGVIE